MNEVTRLLEAVERGEPKAAGELLPLVYEELRCLAAQKMAAERPGHTLQATALVHEAWIRVAGGQNQARFDNRGHFFKAAANAMQRILIDNARRKQRLKRGGELEREELAHESCIDVAVPTDELLAVDEALEALVREDAEAAEIVRMRYFVGMTVPEVGEALGLAPRTVDRQWAYARAWLRRRIRTGLAGPL